MDTEFDPAFGHTHDGTAGNGPKLSSSAFAAGAVNDAAIGNRTINDAISVTGNTWPLTTLLGALGNMIKAITGKANWYTVPLMTLETAGTQLNAATSAATASLLMKRDANGRAKIASPVAADDIATKGYVDTSVVGATPAAATISTLGTTQISASPTSGNPISTNRVAIANDVLLTSTSWQKIATYTPSAKGNFMIMAYFRVIAGTTNVTVQVTYTDGTGAQANTLLNTQPSSVGSYSLIPLFINATSTAAIDVNVIASVANQVYVSASIVGV